MSPGGSRSPSRARPAAASRSASARRPTSAASAARARTGFVPTPKNTSRASATASRSRRTPAARPASAKSPCRRASSSNPQRHAAAARGTATAVRSRPARARSCRCRERSPRRRSPVRRGDRDADRRMKRDGARRQLGRGIGERQAAPERAARRIAAWPTCGMAGAISGACSGRAPSARRLVPREGADHEAFGVARIPSRPGRRLMSMTRVAWRGACSSRARGSGRRRGCGRRRRSVEKVERLRQRGRTVIVERGGLHAGLSCLSNGTR